MAMETPSRLETLPKRERRLALKDILPPKENIRRVDSTNTFAGCGFTSGDFDGLSLEKKLEVAVHIVRQGILINYYPTPDTEAYASGDCATASRLLIEYAKRTLDIPGDFFLASVRRNPFDGQWRLSTRHVVVLHTDTEGVSRTLDPTAMVGYGYGTVSEPGIYRNGRLTPITTTNSLVYEEVTPLTEGDNSAITVINQLRNKFHTGLNVSLEECVLVQNQAERLCSGPHMNSWLSEVQFIAASCALRDGNHHEFRSFVQRAADLDSLKPKLLEFNGLPIRCRHKITETLEAYAHTSVQVAERWLNEALRLFQQPDAEEYPQAIKLIQAAFRELKGSNLLTDEDIPKITVNGHTIPIYNVNPRLLRELNLNTVWIKPCSYVAGVQNAAREAMTHRGRVVWEYTLNPTIPDRFGFIPLWSSHPHGLYPANFASYNGTMRVMLVNNGGTGASETAKSNFRRDWGKYLFSTRSNPKAGSTGNGQQVEWNRFVTNFIHSSDSGAESVVHLLLGYPHLCLVNRWDYPHPTL